MLTNTSLIILTLTLMLIFIWVIYLCHNKNNVERFATNNSTVPCKNCSELPADSCLRCNNCVLSGDKCRECECSKMNSNECSNCDICYKDGKDCKSCTDCKDLTPEACRECKDCHYDATLKKCEKCGDCSDLNEDLCISCRNCHWRKDVTHKNGGRCVYLKMNDESKQEACFLGDCEKLVGDSCKQCDKCQSEDILLPDHHCVAKPSPNDPNDHTVHSRIRSMVQHCDYKNNPKECTNLYKDHCTLDGSSYTNHFDEHLDEYCPILAHNLLMQTYK